MKFKWFIIVIVISFTLLLKISAKESNAVKINLNKDETAIIFILEENLNALYINSQDYLNELIILDYKHDEKQIEKYLSKHYMNKFDKLYTTTPVLIELFNKTSEQINPNNNLIKLKINNKNFCIYIEEYQNKPNLKQCNFLYIKEYKKSLLNNLIGNPGVIFQNENEPLPIHIQEKIYDDWTELYTINNNEYTILKITNNSFDIMIIPKDKYKSYR